ncbi:bifunctional adenosylcobinamide kinase/adenosylcobinamide-phosphate guanylyltransferase [Sporichthya sp.]|uniref:bifunctional adenosylcobinamide kinase/adenosylcobinamide-phosphate guanylyltransferase n=1 Tax=Sporichthya sp. TaxID=65475 RepID=UPI0017AB63D3|nr:bifunctional adenosylcobinamide kinase/adenosylcobinamide-phosphate guanylyltransferase [Sporichthya sp.]MBA3744827.1 bifunctional adenosylcobinamide kinase/adenosylcobinamide-phosphate guanylyltransferase [Sporichthya sp.]
MSDGAPPRRVLLLGGARSGKSLAAETMAARASLLTGGGPVTYVATAEVRPDDPDWAARISAHRDRRPPTWHTVETADPAPALAGGGVVLVDCMALWLTRAMDDAGAWDDGAWATTAPADLAERVNALITAWAESPGTVIAVSNEVGMGVVPATSAGRRFRDELGRLNVRLAAAADEVYLVVAGRLLPLADAAEG